MPCDGTIDTCVVALFLHCCAAHELDPRLLMQQAYPDDGELLAGGRQQQILRRAAREGIRLPARWDGHALAGLMESLTEINWHQLRSVLEDTLQ